MHLRNITDALLDCKHRNMRLRRDLNCEKTKSHYKLKGQYWSEESHYRWRRSGPMAGHYPVSVGSAKYRICRSPYKIQWPKAECIDCLAFNLFNLGRSRKSRWRGGVVIHHTTADRLSLSIGTTTERLFLHKIRPIFSSDSFCSDIWLWNYKCRP